MHESKQEQVKVFDVPLYFVFEPSNSLLVSTGFGSRNFLSLKWFAPISLSSSCTLLFSLQVFFHLHHPWIRISAAQLTPTWENPFNRL